MKKIRIKIISYLLLLNFLAIFFPIHELFHEHETADVHCKVVEAQEYSGDLEHHKKCSHKAHFFNKKEKHICFYTHFNSSYVTSGLYVIVFKKISFVDFLLKNIIKHYFKSLQSYLLRGPPFYFL